MLGDYIRKRRKELKLSQRDLAKLAGVSKTTVVAWENDRFKPQRKLSELEKALEVPRGMLYILIAEDND